MSLLDTSVAVALLVSDHSAHERTIAQLPQGSLGLSGHAVFETFSVITRLPNHRVSPAMAHTLISENFPRSIAYRATLEDLETGPRVPRSTVLSEDEEAMMVAFWRHTFLPLDDRLYALQPTIPHLTRSALHGCLQRHGISRLHAS